jgi:OmpA-OmpF porin, OOP family
MDTGSKILIGAALSALVAWFGYDASCGAGHFSPATDASAGATAAATPSVIPATPEAVVACQGGVNTLMTGKTINFQSGSAYLAADSTALIGDIAKSLKGCAGTTVEVQGHTDLMGNADINQSLSQSRAEAVVKSLVDQGVPAAQLTAKGFGATQPLENARTSAANAKNRRTVFTISTAGNAATADAKPAGVQ